MTLMDNQEIRRKILEYLYQKDEDRPQNLISRDELIKFLGVEGKKIDSNVLYLEEKGYVRLEKYLGSLFGDARITSYGKDLVENPEHFNNEFPIQITQNIVTNSTGTIIGNSNAQTLTISDSFNTIYQELDKQNPEKKEEIIKEVKSIEDELKKETPNKSVIKKGLNFLKENATWITPTIIELIKKSFGF